MPASARALISKLEAELAEVERRPNPTLSLPDHGTLVRMLRDKMDSLLANPMTGSAEIDRLIPKVVVLPYTPIDGGTVVFRARVTIDLAALLTASDDYAARFQQLKREAIVDLYDPPQRIKILPAVSATLTNTPDVTLKWIAHNVTHCTETAVQHSAALWRQMQLMRVSDPYVAITMPDQLQGRHRKHLHRRFKFKPFPGYPVIGTAEPTDEGTGKDRDAA